LARCGTEMGIQQGVCGFSGLAPLAQPKVPSARASHAVGIGGGGIVGAALGAYTSAADARGGGGVAGTGCECLEAADDAAAEALLEVGLPAADAAPPKKTVVGLRTLS
jgi:hypothetical protein